VPSDAPMEEEEDSEENSGASSEERSMSPLHQDEEVLPIVSREEFDLMTCVLDEQPILGNAVSGQRCIRSAGSLPLSKYHPYVRSLYFKGQLRGLPSTKSFRSRYLRKIQTSYIKCRSSGREGDDERSATESIRSSVEPEGDADSSSSGSDAAGDGSSTDPTTLTALAVQSHGDGRGIGWSWNFGRRDLG